MSKAPPDRQAKPGGSGAAEANLLAIVHVAKPHGVHGELSTLPLAPPVLDPQELIVGRTLHVRSAEGRVTGQKIGESVREHQGRWLITLEGIASMTAADGLRMCDLCLPRAELPALPEGWYWEADLAGIEIQDRRLGLIGVVEGLDTNLAQPQLKLRRPNGQTVLIPWVKAFFPVIDPARRQIESDLPADFPGISDSPG